ncbi:PTS transporter subunit EIIC, partial [Priestia megaterium]|uniref:PTS transporter subunit EIIC n=3 Tax=Bacillaceae TaxID=186817 RepID=UPI002FFD7092
FAQLADPSTTKYYDGVSRFMSGRFITMMFGLPGAALAIYHCAKPENKKLVGGLLLSAALTSFLTGITEPLEFSFLFVAPILYIFHALFDGLAFMLSHILSITVGQTFSGGLIDFILFGILQGVDKTNWIFVPLVGIPWFFLYYFTFKFLITKRDLKVLGREESKQEVHQVKATERTQTIVQGLGKEQNIVVVDCCATRLRVTVKKEDLIKEELIKQTGAKGIIKKGNGIQIVYGPQVTIIKNEIEEYLGL